MPRLKMAFIISALGLFACQKQTTIAVTLLGQGLEPGRPLPATHLTLQLIQPSGGNPYATFDFSASSATGLQEGTVAHASLNPPSQVFTVDLAGAVLDPNQVILGAVRQTVSIVAGQDNQITL